MASAFRAWASGLPRRLRSIPWSTTATEATSVCFLFTKVACAVHLVNAHLVGIGLVQGPSMIPTLKPSGDVILIDKLAPRLGNIRVGDLVFYRSPIEPKKTVVKRVIGLEGDQVAFVDGNRTQKVVVPKDHIWVQGDNLYVSRDSRQYGAVPYGLVLGRAFCRILPLEDFGMLKQE